MLKFLLAGASLALIVSCKPATETSAPEALVPEAQASDETSAPAALNAFEVQGFRTQIVVEIDAARQDVWDAATGDISPWWDHSFALEPAELYIEPVAGGMFYEVIEDGADDGAVHATVIYVQAPQSLRLHGPLGLSGRSYDLVSSWTLTEAESGGTTFTVDLSMHGEIDAELAGVVRNVWVHFIDNRLKTYMENGCYREPEAPCAAFEE
ncbi:SRPBCC domain-containing protein [Maricaulis sp.]|uniref:SRPBCC family protein n=1 Tax=Maricaulis sp. TaxID=1486257 RepID=UPI0026097E30|nr:SRPBCC domain-containing protein [Maricaulis sp.]